jgi:hypothetical protein
MLAWTPAGAVARPRTVEAELQRAYPDRVPAGAPVPTRSMTLEEVGENLRWFNAASARGLPIEAVVLSGQGVAARADLPAIVATARSLGVTRVVVHAGVEELAALRVVAGVDRYVLPVRTGPGGAAPDALAAAFAGARAAGVAVDANAPLRAEALASLDEAVGIALAGGAASMTFSYPFPTGGDDAPPSVPAAVAALAGPAARVESAGVPLAVKGLPACWLGSLGRHARRSANRWYVDADHQKESAMLFFPGVVAFAKADPCRFCAADAACDGYLPAWSGRPGNPPLRPVERP